ncbi:MAG: CofH family radical SAM protein [Opitutales bacterium]
MINVIEEKILNRDRLTKEEGLYLFSLPIFTLGRLANMRLESLVEKPNERSYIKNRMINYANTCLAKCKFCAFHSEAGIIPTFKMTDDEIFEQVETSVAKGATQIMLQGGLSNDYNIAWAINLAKRIKNTFKDLSLHIFSPSEIIYFSKASRLKISEALRQLRDAGVASVPGAADLLVDEFRKDLSPLKPTRNEWQEVILEMAKLGMKSSATMTFAMGETFADRIEHLDFVRGTQDISNCFEAFIAWPLAPENTGLNHLRRTSSVDFLKTLAISRIYLDNIVNIQSGWLTEGLNIAQLSFDFGANDFGGILMDEMVIKSAGIENSATEEKVCDMIRAIGKIPFERNANYKKL